MSTPRRGVRRVTGLPLGALVVPASTHEDVASHLMLDNLTRQDVTERLELVLVGLTELAVGRSTVYRASQRAAARQDGECDH
jgi:hypothetical protein